jgi:hypothetical protein
MASPSNLLEPATADGRNVQTSNLGVAIDPKKRLSELIASFNDASADTPWKQAIRMFFKYCAKPLIAAFVAFVWLMRKVYEYGRLLPTNVLRMIFGLGLCFFGGTYFAAIAAIEGFINFGGAQLYDELKVLYDDCCLVADASVEDDAVDADHNGIADVQEMSTSDYLTHKATVAMIAVKDPSRLMQALSFFMMAYFSVIATLRFEFARTVALCLAITDMLKVPLFLVFGPLVSMLLGPKMGHWAEATIMTTIKIIAVIAACYVQEIISAFYSGIRGGTMFAIAFINFMSLKGYMDSFPCVPKPFDAEKTYVDEAVAYPLAAVGFFVQFHFGFSLTFPLNIILLPLTIVEWILRWEIFGAAL